MLADGRGRRTGGRTAVLILGVVVLLPAAVASVARLTGWEAGPLAYAVALVPWLLVLAVAALVLGLLARSLSLVLAASAVTVLGIVWLAPLYVADAPRADGVAPVLTVATVNLTVGAGDADAVVALVRDRGIDLLSVQELTPEDREAMRAAGLDELMPFSEVRAEPGVTGTGLWSRLPTGDSGAIDGFVSRAIRADVRTTTGELTVIAVHPAAPGPREHARWDADTALLYEVLSQQTGPVLVAGDFNTTRDHRVFRNLEALGYADAADQAGAGLQPTYPQGRAPFPIVAIDHVLTRDTGLRAVSVETVVLPGADHRALVVSYAAAT
jgi:endonuclease/exonuclease/phosphatase (EEP) superfamily protein YafD